MRALSKGPTVREVAPFGAEDGSHRPAPMLKTIVDRCPDASPGRERYYLARIDRALGPFADRLRAVTVDIDRAGDARAPRFGVRLTLELADGTWRAIETDQPDLPGALGSAFDAGTHSLRTGEPPAGVVYRTGAGQGSGIVA